MRTVTVRSHPHLHKSQSITILYCEKIMIMRKAIRREEEKCLYHVMFLKNDEHKDICVEEVEKVDFEELGEHLQLGESVFIANRTYQKLS